MPLNFLPLSGWIQIFALIAILVLLAKPLGFYLARILAGERCFLTPALRPVETMLYKLCSIDPDQDMNAGQYTKALFAFSFIGFMALYLILLWQDFPIINPALAFESSISFLTGTNWQSSAPEITFTNTSQQFGFTIQNFLSAAVGIAVMAALARGIGNNRPDKKLGNFWTDITRSTLYLLLPLCIIMAIFLISQGVIQRFDQMIEFTTLEAETKQFMAVGPVASQVAIKQLGTNGGGFFMANAAHPFENPTPLSNFVQILALLLLPTACVFAFGKMIKATRQSWMLLGTMLLIFIPAVLMVAILEHAGNPLLEALGVHGALGNLEGKELRFSAAGAALFTSAAGATSGGSLNASLDSFMPLASFVPLVLMQFGEMIFGGVGTGLCNMIIYVFFAVFTASLMIGRTPQYLGKKIGVDEIKMVSLVIIIPALLTLVGAAWAVLSESGQSAATHVGPHGFSQILYAFTSASNNNGSSLGGISAASDFYHMALGSVMLLGRFGTIWATLILAGSLARQRRLTSTHGMLRTDTAFFVFFLIIIIFLGMLTYVPALALGPIAEHLMMGGG